MSKEQGKGKMHPLVAFDEMNGKYEEIKNEWLEATGINLNFKKRENNVSEEYLQTLVKVMKIIFFAYVNAGVDYLLKNINNVEIVNLIAFYKALCDEERLNMQLCNTSLQDISKEYMTQFGLDFRTGPQLEKAKRRKEDFAITYNEKVKVYQLLVSFDLVENLQREPISGLAALVALASFSKDIFLEDVDFRKEDSYLRADANMALLFSNLSKNFNGVFLEPQEQVLVSKYPTGEKSLEPRYQSKVSKYVRGVDLRKNKFSPN